MRAWNYMREFIYHIMPTLSPPILAEFCANRSERFLKAHCRTHAPMPQPPKGQNGPPKAFYQPDILGKGPISPNHVRTTSGISPSQRGVPKPYSMYGSECIYTFFLVIEVKERIQLYRGTLVFLYYETFCTFQNMHSCILHFSKYSTIGEVTSMMNSMNMSEGGNRYMNPNQAPGKI